MKNFSVTIVNANEISAVEMLTNNLVKGQTATITMKESDSSNFMNKRGNPYFGKVTKVTTYHGWQVGTNYEKSCNNAAQRSGSEEKVNLKPSWHTFYNEFFETDKATRTKYYLQVQKSQKMSSYTETSYYMDGKQIDKSMLETWLKKSSKEQSSTQIEAGVTAENTRHYNTLTLAKITTIQQGEFQYNINKEIEVQSEATAK